MELREVVFKDAVPIEGYGPGFFRVAGQVIHGPVLVTAERAVSWGGLEDTGPLLALIPHIDVLFIGMGADIRHPPAALRDAADEAGLAIECMASPSACRTYNVLLSEGRRVGVALLPI